jgi:hypothetical protein
MSRPCGGDGRVGVRDELGHGLGEFDPRLGEVLPEVAAPDAADREG